MPRHRPPLPCVLRCRRRISCRSACCQAPSSGLLQRSPLRRRTGWSPLPRARGLASVSRCHAAHMFRPRGFSPPRRLPPPDGRRLVASCCRPWGSPGLSLVGSDVPVAPWGLLTDATPSRAFPSTGSRACVTADRCPLAVDALAHARPRGLAPPGSPLPCQRPKTRIVNPRQYKNPSSAQLCCPSAKIPAGQSNVSGKPGALKSSIQPTVGPKGYM